MFTLHLTVHGRAIEPTEHESFTEMGDTLAKALSDADMELKPRTMFVLLSLMFSDLHARQTWTWVAEDYEIFVARSSS